MSSITSSLVFFFTKGSSGSSIGVKKICNTQKVLLNYLSSYFSLSISSNSLSTKGSLISLNGSA